MPENERVMDGIKTSVEQALKTLRGDLARVYAGQPDRNLIAGVGVEIDGVWKSVEEIGTITVAGRQLVTVRLWEKNLGEAVGESVRNAASKAGFKTHPIVDGSLVQVPFPALTEDEKRESVKAAKRCGEDANVAIRQSLRNELDTVTKLAEDGKLTVDEADTLRQKIRDFVAQSHQDVDAVVSAKEKVILGL